MCPSAYPGAVKPSFIHLLIDLPRRHQNERRHRQQSAPSSTPSSLSHMCILYIIYIYRPAVICISNMQRGKLVKLLIRGLASSRRLAVNPRADALPADLSRHSTPNADATLHDRLQPRPHCVRAKHQHRSKRSWRSPRQLFPADARVLPGCAGGSPPASRREPALLSLRAQWVGHVQPPRACTSPPQQGRRREQGSDSARLSHGSAAWSK